MQAIFVIGLTNLIPSAIFLVLFELIGLNERLKGLSFKIFKKQNLIYKSDTQGMDEEIFIGLKKEYQGKGIGSLLLNEFENRAKNNIYIEIQRHNEFQEKNFENYLLEISKKLNLPLIASQEIFYLNQDMYEAHDALVCIGEKNFVDDRNRFKYNDQHFFKSTTDLKNLYSDIPEALENNYNFPFRCSFRPLPSKPILPNISSISDDNNLVLQNESIKGLKEKFSIFFSDDLDEIEKSSEFIKFAILPNKSPGGTTDTIISPIGLML